MTTEKLTLGSLFDGSGSFPFGGILAGIEPKWNSDMPGLGHITVSISHHDRCAAVSVSAIPHGVDIELVRPVNGRLFPRVFSPEELAVCGGLSDGRQEEYFFRIWTRKEALIKTGAITLGGMHTVYADGDTLSYRGNTHYFYTYSSGPLTPGCILSVCSRGTPAGPVLYTADRTSKLDAAAVLDRLYFDKQ